MPGYGRGEVAIKLKIRGKLVTSAIMALISIAGCGAAGSNGAAGAGATPGFNGPFGRGGPFEGLSVTGPANPGAAGTLGKLLGGTSPSRVTGTAGQALGRKVYSGGSTVRPGALGGSAVQVGGSTALEGRAGMPWLFALGSGVSASAPESVQPGTDSPADAAAGFYDAFYARRFAAACDYVAPAQQANCLALLRKSSGSADSLDSPAIGFVVIKGNEALVTMTGLLCRTATGCVGQHNAHWIFGASRTFDGLWSLTASQGGNPLTVTPVTEVAGRWYLDLRPSPSAR
jgi:hypothetical protein